MHTVQYILLMNNRTLDTALLQRWSRQNTDHLPTFKKINAGLYFPFVMHYKV